MQLNSKIHALLGYYLVLQGKKLLKNLWKTKNESQNTISKHWKYM